jgi:hypothetical protein
VARRRFDAHSLNKTASRRNGNGGLVIQALRIEAGSASKPFIAAMALVSIKRIRPSPFNFPFIVLPHPPNAPRTPARFLLKREPRPNQPRAGFFRSVLAPGEKPAKKAGALNGRPFKKPKGPRLSRVFSLAPRPGC